MVIAFFVFVESVTRLVDPPNINTDMLTVSDHCADVRAFFSLINVNYVLNMEQVAWYLQ